MRQHLTATTRAFSPVLSRREAEQYVIHTHRPSVSGSNVEEPASKPGLAPPEDKDTSLSRVEESTIAEELRRENEELRMQVQVLRDEQAYTVELHSQVIATVVKERNDLVEQLKAANEVSTGIADSSHCEEENSEIKLPDSQLSAMKEDVSPAVSAVLVERPQLFLEGMKDRVDSPPDSPSPRNPMENSACASRAQLWELQGALRKALQSKPISRSQVVATSPEPPVRSPPPPPPPSPYQHMARAIPARNCSSPPVCHRHLAGYSPMSASFRNTLGGGELAVVHAAVRGRAVFRPPLAPGAGTPTGPYSPTRMISGPAPPRGSLGGASLIATCPTPARAQAQRHVASAASTTTAKPVVATATSPPPAVVRAVSARRAAWRGVAGQRGERSPSPALGFASSPGPLVARVVTPGPRYRMTAAPVATGSVITHPPGVSSPMPPVIAAGVSVTTAAACGTASPAAPPSGTRQNVIRVRCQQEAIPRFVSAPVGPQLSASHGQCWGSPGGASPSASFRRTRASPVRSASFQPRVGTPVGCMVNRPVAVVTASDKAIDASVSSVLVATVAEAQGFAPCDSAVTVAAKPGFPAACDSSVTVAAKDLCPSVQEVELPSTEPPRMAKAEADTIQEEDKENLKDAAWISNAMATDVPEANSNREDPEMGAIKATQLLDIQGVASLCLQRHGINTPNTCR